MIYRRSVGDEQRSLSISHAEGDTEAIAIAKQKLDQDDGESARRILAPLIEAGNAEAMYLGANFSWGKESPEQFERRHLEMLRDSAKRGYPPALYTLGTYFDMGDLLEADKTAAAALFKQAAEAGHAHSQWIYGIELLYGHGCYEKNEKEGIKLILEAAHAGFQGALETLARFHEKGEFGFAVDLEAAESLRKRATADDVIGY
jgi:TPR repeat protein